MKRFVPLLAALLISTGALAKQNAATDQYGEIITETWKAADKMVVAILEKEELESCTGRRWLQVRRPELYHPLTESTGSERQTRDVRFGSRRE